MLLDFPRGEVANCTEDELSTFTTTRVSNNIGNLMLDDVVHWTDCTHLGGVAMAHIPDDPAHYPDGFASRGELIALARVTGTVRRGVGMTMCEVALSGEVRKYMEKCTPTINELGDRLVQLEDRAKKLEAQNAELWVFKEEMHQ
jgi:hypothetical protein